jgi:hypothetical protein
MKKSPRPHFSGRRRGYCNEPDCPVRDVFYAIKRDATPDAPAVCPRCQRPLTLFHWREESAREFWPVLEAEGNVLRRQQG